MNTLERRLQHCEREIARAIEESCKPHTEAEHVGILLWEMDWRAKRENILVELAANGGGVNAATTTGRLRTQASTIHY